jgi:hypothetical protein
MVNHLRCLLLNLPASPDAPGEEFVESSFQARLLDASQAALRGAVFPQPFGRPYLNFIATALTRLAYDSIFRDSLLALDSRMLLSDPAVDAAGFASGATIQKINSADSVRVTGTLAADTTNGIFTRTWVITKVSDTQIGVWDGLTGQTSTATLTFTGNVSSPVSIEVRSSLQLRLFDVSVVPVGLQATVTANVPMGYDLLDLHRRMQNSTGVRQLFFSPAVAPVAEACRRAFDNVSHPDASIAAALTAYAYSFQEGQ